MVARKIGRLQFDTLQLATQLTAMGFSEEQSDRLTMLLAELAAHTNLSMEHKFTMKVRA